MLSEIENALRQAGSSPSPCVERFVAKEPLQSESLPSVYRTSWLAQSTVLAAAMELHGLLQTAGWKIDEPVVSTRLASLWFGDSLVPIGWQAPPSWDAISGDYQTADGWIKVHANYSHHKAAALQVVSAREDREAVAAQIKQWQGNELEAAIVEAGGCAAAMRNSERWLQHEQGRAVAAEPLIDWSQEQAPSGLVEQRFEHFKSGLNTAGKPLKNLRVLDLTRVLAGPAATRFLAAFGANVLRIDPGHWNEQNPTFEMSVGKTRAHLDLKSSAAKLQLETLLKDADVFVHGYRPGALDALGFSKEKVRQINPALVEASLCAYGWSGPWAGRRGFDSLVQMSSGIADHGQTITGKSHPVPLPVQALDHGTGYLLAASVLRGLSLLYQQHQARSARLSLARTAMLLINEPLPSMQGELVPANAEDFQEKTEQTDWGPVKRLRFPFSLEHCEPGWDIPAGELRIHAPQW